MSFVALSLEGPMTHEVPPQASGFSRDCGLWTLPADPAAATEDLLHELRKATAAITPARYDANWEPGQPYPVLSDWSVWWMKTDGSLEPCEEIDGWDLRAGCPPEEYVSEEPHTAGPEPG